MGVIAGLLVPLAPIGATPAAEAAKASGGGGRYTQSIEWLSWGVEGASVTNGTRTNTSIVGGLPLAVTCRISNLSGGLVVYSPGTWQGDAFDEMYNSGATGTSNTLDVGLRPNADNATRTFDLSCSATYNGANLPLAGLVFADAEQSGDLEHVGATAPAGSTWRLIDRYRNAGCTDATYAYRPSSNPTRLELYGAPTANCAAGPAAVAFVQGAQSLANVTVRGGGLSAIALGVMVTLDFGDAPASYGEAGAVLQAQYDGGIIPTTNGNWATNSRGVNAFTAIDLATPSPAATTTVGSLGAIVDGELAAFDTAGTGDDISGLDDEDSQFTFPNPTTGVATTSGVLQVAAYPGQSYSTTISCTGGGAVRGWIDWARDGSFGTGDASQQTVCANGSATLTWSVPTSAIASPAATPSYLRLRMGATGTTLQPTGIIAVGEVEDHPIVVSMPRIAVTKTTSLGTDVGQPGDTVRYTVVLRNTGDARASTVTISDNLSGVLTGATYVQGSASVTVPRGTAGTPTRSGSTLSWSGWTSDLRPGESVQLTYDVVLTEARRGSTLTNTATGSVGTGSNRITASGTAVIPVAVTLEVRKVWIVDGVSYPNGSQPAGLSAAATATGPSTAGASALEWGVPRDGYVSGASVTLGEMTSIDPSLACTLGSATASTGGAQQPLATPVVLTSATTVVTITNTVECQSQLTLITSVSFGSASPASWTLTATGPSGFAGTSGVTGTIRPATPYTLSQSGGPATYSQQGQWSCVDVASGQTVAVVGETVQVPLGKRVQCTVVQSTAQLILLKSVVNDNGGTLVPRDFALTATPAALATVPGLTATTVVGRNAVAAANTFDVRPGHGYALTEELGAYAYLGQSIQRYVGPGAATRNQLANAANWQTLTASEAAAIAVPAERRAIYRFVNDDAPALTLPLTGGIGADSYLFGGAGVLMLGLLSAAVLLVRTRIRYTRRMRRT